MQTNTNNRFSFLIDDDKDNNDVQDNEQRSTNMFLTTKPELPNNNFRNASLLFKPVKKEENNALPQKNSRWGYLENEIMEEQKFRDEKNMFKSNDRNDGNDGNDRNDRNDRNDGNYRNDRNYRNDGNDRDKHGNYRKSFFQSSKRKKTPPPKKFEFIKNDFPGLS
jgi:hypothetical protein